ncbi:hypothetical protein ABMA32_20575 [Mesorhizobium sp. VNQ89]|uniref:hypothetical protein n=1 Tax=Mesorhizobium quangtriensis TaxID=3157709 RepID=UPI0032B81649
MKAVEFCGAEIFMFARTKRLTVVSGLRLNSIAPSGGYESATGTLRASEEDSTIGKVNSAAASGRTISGDECFGGISRSG